MMAYLVILICNLVIFLQLKVNADYVKDTFDLISNSPEINQNLE